MIGIFARTVRALSIAILVTSLAGLSSCGKIDNSNDSGNKVKAEEGTLVASDQIPQLLLHNAWCASKTSPALTETITARFSQDGTFSREMVKCKGQQGSPGFCEQGPASVGTWKVTADGYLETNMDNLLDRAKVYLLSIPGEQFKKVRVKGDNGDFSDFTEC